MKPFLILFLAFFIVTSCMKGEAVDLIVHNARIHTMDDKNSVVEAMAIRDGKVVEVGAERQILNKYSSEKTIDAGKKDVFPGFTDAHGHVMSYARQKLSADLVGCSSFEELLVRVEKYDQKKQGAFVLGRGWDQSLWSNNALPNNEKLNAMFPKKPVLLHRVDGHAALVNQAALDLAGITPTTKIEGGGITVKDGKCTGLLLDNAITLIASKLPDFNKKDLNTSILEVQQELLQYGITGIHEAGVEQKDLQVIRQLVEGDQLHLDAYVMLRPSSENIAFAKKNGVYKNKNLIVRSFKVMGDGALGSRGALLKQPYEDEHDTYGLLTTSPEEMHRIAAIAESIGYQVNIHAIGDSTNRIVLDIMKDIYARNKDHRWRLEHAQVVDMKDFELFAQSGVFPSVQPTHAVSDQRWAADRLGKNRLKGAYAYKTILNKAGMVALGTDFPVELTNPFLTIQAAVKRNNSEGVPLNGFLASEALTEEECMRGMTIWTAYASFQEEQLGSLEAGKDATFVILSAPFQVVEKFVPNFAQLVFIRGKERYSAE